MAGAMRKMAVYLGLVEDDERYDESYDDYDEARPAGRDHAREPGREHAVTAMSDRRVAPARTQGHPHPPVATAAAASAMTPAAPRPSQLHRITTIHPRTYNDARQIGEAFRESTPVIMNLTEMDDSDAKRLVDFAAGLIFGLRGSIERVTNKVFLLSPADVEVTAEDKALMVESGFFNQS
jgi:cell division inhibitor SepF